MALKEPERKVLWVEDAWILLDSLFSGQENVAVGSGAYALALIAWLRFVRTSRHSQFILTITKILLRKLADVH